MTSPWWRDAVCYQLYIRSFADSDGDGKGDLQGITEHLGHLVDLGVDALWLNPFYPSPQNDHGYDVIDFRDVEPAYGTLDDFDTLIHEAHARGLKLLADIVPNHTSSEHLWFQEALESAPGSPERDRYVFRPGRGPDGAEPPNNWLSVFGGPAWARVPDGEWYLHLFDSTQPDLDWRNPEVAAEFEKTLRFWLDRGVDGFRIDVAQALFKEEPRDRGSEGELRPGARDHSMVERDLWDEPDVGPARGATTCTGAGSRSSTGTTATGWPSPRPGPRRPSRRRSSCDPTSSSRRSTSPGCSRDVVGRRRSTRSITTPSPRSARSRARADLGAVATTTWSGTRPATAAAPVAWPAPGPPRWRCWRCPARRTSTRARSSASSRSTSPGEDRQDPS